MPSPAERGTRTAVEERNYASRLVSCAYLPRLQDRSAHGGDQSPFGSTHTGALSPAGVEATLVPDTYLVNDRVI